MSFAGGEVGNGRPDLAALAYIVRYIRELVR